jgi:transcriptional regulator GlxA family with amidase domain
MNVSIAILVPDRFIDEEVLETKMICEEENVGYHFFSFSGGSITGVGGLNLVTDTLPSLEELAGFQALLLVESNDSFSGSDASHLSKIADEIFFRGKAIVSIGAAIQLLFGSGILKDRRVAVPQDLISIVKQQGATVVDEPVVVDGTFFSAQGVQQTYQLVHALCDHLRKEYS